MASRWTEVEVYATYMKLTGEIEVPGSQRLSDVVNGGERYLSLRDSRAEPLSVNYPVLSRVEPHTAIAKSAVILLCPLEEGERERIPGAQLALFEGGHQFLWQDATAYPRLLAFLADDPAGGAYGPEGSAMPATPSETR